MHPLMVSPHWIRNCASLSSALIIVVIVGRLTMIVSSASMGLTPGPEKVQQRCPAVHSMFVGGPLND